MDFLKPILGDDLFGQVAAKLKDSKVKLADLSTGDYLALAKHTAKVEELQQQTSTLQATLTQRDADLAELNTKFMTAQTDANLLQEARTQLTALQTKYDADKANLETQLKKQRYATAVKDCVAELKFTSTSAKKAFLRDLEEKQLPLEGEQVLGLTDFVTAYKASDPTAFVADVPPVTPPEGAPKPPTLVLPTGEQKPPEPKVIPTLI